MERYFLTVDWCSKGKRGIFSDRDGNAFGKDDEHTTIEMMDILGPFALILSPKSEPFSEDVLAGYTSFIPLAEYSHQYGIVLSG